jgi:hypothetical protein
VSQAVFNQKNLHRSTNGRAAHRVHLIIEVTTRGRGLTVEERHCFFVRQEN